MQADIVKITVYVRKGQSKDSRLISIPRPLGISPKEWLDFDYALDGNQCIKEVPASSLREEEINLTTFLFEKLGPLTLDFK